MDLLRMRWRDVVFAHWRVDPETVAARLPDGLHVATHDGDAWLGVVGFVMSDIRPRGVPAGRSFPELNLRTYVTGPDGDRGVYFYSLDAADRLGVSVARGAFRLPYYRAEMRHTREDDGATTLRSRRTHDDAPPARFDATYRQTGETWSPEPGSLAAFLTENYRFYTEGAELYAGDISHPRWSLADATATIRSNTLFSANGFDAPPSDPLVHYSPGIDVTAGGLGRVG
jgi:uncharacterized protein YqjF (DUF2071 family)